MKRRIEISAVGKNNCLAYSLLELLVVMAIAGLLVTLTPALFKKGVSSAELKGAARSLVAGLRSARSQAITKQQAIALIINTETNQFNIEQQTKIYQFPKNLQVSLVIAESEQVDEFKGAIRFFADGSSTGGRVVLAYGERQYQVDILWLSGQISIAD